MHQSRIVEKKLRKMENMIFSGKEQFGSIPLEKNYLVIPSKKG